LFGANANTTVTSINRTPGAGITVNYPTGNVVVSANIACVQVSTSSLSIGRGSNGFSNALITSSAQTLVVDIDPDGVYSNYFADVGNGLAVFNGNISTTASNQANITRLGALLSLNVSGNANFSGSNTYISSVANLKIPGGSVGYGLVTDGSGNLSWSAAVTGNSTPGGVATSVQFQGTGSNAGKFSGNAGFTFLAGNGLLSAPSLAIAQDATAANFIGPLTNGNSNISIATNSNITFTSNGNAVMLLTNIGAGIAGALLVTGGNVTVDGNVNANNGIFTTSANIPIIQQGNSNITITNGGNITVYANGNSTARFTISNDGITTNGASNVSGALTVGGNISTYGSNGKLQANNHTVTGAATGNANVSTVTGDLGLRSIASIYTDNSAAASSTIANAAIHAIAQPTLAASNSTVTFTNAAALYIANAPAAGANATITNPYSLFIANGSTYFGGTNMYVAGNLTVAGNATYYNINSFVVQDPIISIGGGPNGNALLSNDGKDRGVALQYFTTAPVTAFMGWDNSNGEFAFGRNVSIASEVVSFTNLGNARGLTWLGNVDGTYANFTGNITTTGNANLGNTASANYFVGRFYGTANITSVGTLTSLSVTANTTSNNFIGKLANGNSNISITADSNIAFNAVGVGIANITGTGINVAGTGNFTGNLAAAAYYGPLANGNSNVQIASANGSITLTAVGNTIMTITGTGANIAGTANVTGNANVGNIGATQAIISTSANIPIIQQGNSNITITSNANISHFVAGNATSQLTVTSTGANISGTANIVGNANVGNLGAAQVLASANITTLQFISNVATGTAPFSVQSTTRVSNLNVNYANVADYGVVTTQTTGTFYPVFVSGNSTANYAHGSNANLSFNAATGNLSTTILSATYLRGDGSNITNLNISAGTSIVNGTSNVSVPASGGNVNTVVAGNTTLVVTGTGANITGTANISGNANVGNIGATNGVFTNVSGNGNSLSSIQGANVSGTVANATYATSAGSAGSATTTGTVTTNAQPNITSVGTLLNTTLGSSNSLSGGNLVSATYLTGTLTTASQPNITSVGTLLNTTLGSSNSLSGGNLVSATYLTGTLTTNAQPNITSTGTLTGLNVNGNITASTFTSNVATGTAPFTVTSTTQVANLSVATAGTATSATTAGTVTTAAQPNITSVGTLTSLGVNGTITALNITANTGVFTGNGSGLTSLAGANVTGTVPNSNVANFVAVTGQTTGTYYPVFVNGSTTTNYAPGVTSGISFNVATNTVSATAFAGNLTATGTVQAANVISTAFIQRAVTNSIAANGSTQAQATVLTTEINIVSAVGVGTGVRLPAAISGTVVYITNASANSLVVYPQTGGVINNLATNIGFTQGSNSTLQYVAPTTSQWYTVGATWA
jgi:hypothetical protein